MKMIIISMMTVAAVVAIAVTLPKDFMRQPTQAEVDAYAKAEANKYTNVREPGVPYFDMRAWKDGKK